MVREIYSSIYSMNEMIFGIRFKILDPNQKALEGEIR
jgi:hypothetical protein